MRTDMKLALPSQLQPVQESELTSVDGGFLKISPLAGGGIDIELLGKYSVSISANEVLVCGTKSCVSLK